MSLKFPLQIVHFDPVFAQEFGSTLFEQTQKEILKIISNIEKFFSPLETNFAKKYEYLCYKLLFILLQESTFQITNTSEFIHWHPEIIKIVEKKMAQHDSKYQSAQLDEKKENTINV